MLDRRISLCLLTGGLAIALGWLSCGKAERSVTPTTADEDGPPAYQTVDSEGGDGSEEEPIGVETASRDSMTFGGTQIGVLSRRPEPGEFISWILSAYSQRNAAMLSVILAEEFVCTAITSGGERSWDRDTEIRIHGRMFDPNCEVRPFEDIQLELDNTTVIPPSGDPADLDGIWTIRCDAHLVLDYASPEDGVWEFAGPAEFLIRANPDSPCHWELVAWHDQLPYD